MFLEFSGLGNDGNRVQFLAVASVQICKQLYGLFHYNLEQETVKCNFEFEQKRGNGALIKEIETRNK